MNSLFNESLKTFCKIIKDAFHEGVGEGLSEDEVWILWQGSNAKKEHDKFFNQIEN